jgi:hypothetical protein
MAAVATTRIGGRIRPRTYTAGAANMLRGLALVQGANDFTANQCAAANAVCIGVQDESTYNAGDPLSCVQLGEAPAIAGAAVAAGQYVIATAAGQFIPSAAIGDNIVGRAVSSAAIAGDEFVIFVMPSIR